VTLNTFIAPVDALAAMPPVGTPADFLVGCVDALPVSMSMISGVFLTMLVLVVFGDGAAAVKAAVALGNAAICGI